LGKTVLMRGHGDAVVGPSPQVAIFRAIYTEVNANLQLQASMLGGPITFLNQYESKKPQGVERTWEACKRQALEQNAMRRWGIPQSCGSRARSRSLFPVSHPVSNGIVR
jgi:ribulose-5-phosphate 4-epimerase/fuculose-1-phosphate aldolase